jgi:ABC-type Fe3+-hydroxamate transport system substrate-binding protein
LKVYQLPLDSPLTTFAKTALMPAHIISLVPSQTELLYDLGLDKEVIGITKFCIHPKEWFQNKTRIGGTKTANIKKIKSLSPDLIIANKEENVKEQVEALSEVAPVYVSDITTLQDALDMIEHVGKLVGKEKRASEIAKNIRIKFKFLDAFISTNPQSKFLNQLNTAYLIWKDPYMAAGGDTFIHDMLTRCGFNNILSDKQRYPVVSVSDLSSLNCQLLLLSSEPYPFKQKHINELQQQLGGTKILLVDGEMFSWYGSRLLHSGAYFQTLLTEIHQPDLPKNNMT